MPSFKDDPAYHCPMLAVSTGQIPKATADALGSLTSPLYAAVSYVPWHEYGWIFYTSEAQAHAARETGHSELAAVLELAEKEGFTYLLLDCDASLLPETFNLPTFEW